MPETFEWVSPVGNIARLSLSLSLALSLSQNPRSLSLNLVPQNVIMLEN